MSKCSLPSCTHFYTLGVKSLINLTVHRNVSSSCQKGSLGQCGWTVIFLYDSIVSPDARGRVPSSGSAGAGRGFQYRGRPALSRLTAHDLPCDWHQKPLLRPLPEVHANRAVRNCGDTRRNSRDYRWVTANEQCVFFLFTGLLFSLFCCMLLWLQAKYTVADVLRCCSIYFCNKSHDLYWALS